MLKVIHVLDSFDRDAVGAAGPAADAASWTVPDVVGLVAEWAEETPAAPAATDALAEVLGDAANTSSVPSWLVRLTAETVGRPWGNGTGWVGLHVLAVADAPTAGGLSVFRPEEAADPSGWELTLHLPVEDDRLFVFRRSMGCAWTGAQPGDGSALLARAFLIPETAA